MKLFLLCLLGIPLLSQAQVNRSATELAQENIKGYLVAKLFQGKAYSPVSYGQLKSRVIKSNTEIAWSLDHRFEIRENAMVDGKRVMVNRPYKFTFFMDREMEVLRADGAYIE